MKKITLKQLKIYVKSNNRICPKPLKWSRMYEIIQRNSASKILPNLMPLILGGWDASDDEKRNRLELQIDFSFKNSILFSRVSNYLLNLKDTDWYCG
jgi:hypothetical protein